MPYVIRIESKEAFDLLSRMVNNSHARMHDNISAYVEWIAPIDLLHEAIQSVEVEIPRPEDIVIPEPPRTTIVESKRGKRGKTKVVQDLPPLCADHPKFKAQRAPRTTCTRCWQVYKELNPTRHQNAHRNFLRKNQ